MIQPWATFRELARAAVTKTLRVPTSVLMGECWSGGSVRRSPTRSAGLDAGLTAHTTAWPERPGRPEPSSLLAGCRRGDAEAWDQLVSRYERLVFSVAQRNGLAREDAADVTQATFVALLESLDSVRDEDRLGSWLMTVCRRQAWAFRNRARRETPGPEADADRPDEHDAIACWERLTVLHDALDALDRSCRDLLDALYLDPAQPSYQEVADRLGRRIGGIGPMRARCLDRVRRLMGEDVFG